MNQKEINSLSIQLMYCHSANKKSPKPVNLVLTGWVGDKLRGRLKSQTAENWGIEIYPELNIENVQESQSKWYIDLYDKEKLVYLTADSENTLEKLEDDKVYIIGGIVDHNRHKNIWFDKAKAQGISHAKFPIEGNVNIGDYSTVLTVNHVVSILLAVRNYDNDWKRALEENMPKRKSQKVKGVRAKVCIRENELKELIENEKAGDVVKEE